MQNPSEATDDEDSPDADVSGGQTDKKALEREVADAERVVLPYLIQRAAAQDDIASLKWHLSALTRLEKISAHPSSTGQVGRLQVPRGGGGAGGGGGGDGNSGSIAHGAASTSNSRPSITSPTSLSALGSNEAASPLDECYPLHIASSRGHISCVKALLSAGSSVHLRDYTDHTPLYLAAKNGHLEVVRVLVEAGAHLAEDEGKEAKWELHRDDGIDSEQVQGRERESHEKAKKVWKEAGIV